MVELVSIKTCTAIWNVDGKTFCFRRRKNIDDTEMQRYIEKYIVALKNKEYSHKPKCISEMLHILPDTVMLHIGVE